MKVVVVTGGSKGLGLMIVNALLGRTEFSIIVIARTMSDELRQLCEDGRVQFIAFDLSRVNQIYELSKEVAQLAGDNLYGLVNNAAIGGDGILATQHEKDIENIINVNQIAPILLSKYLGRQMLRRRRGHIINVSSVVAKTGYSGLSVYASTKAALLGFSRSLAREYGKFGICVNTVLPGFMETEMTSAIGDDSLKQIARRSPTRTLPSTSSVARVTVEILSTEDYSINGAEFVIDAGNTA